MAKRPFGPKEHCTIDDGFVAALLSAPSLFGLKGSARTLCYFFGGAAGVLTALTNQPFAWRRVVPFRVHGQVDTPFVPTLLLLPWMTGALQQRNARRFFFPFTSGKRRESTRTGSVKQPGDPMRGAEAVIKAVESPAPPLRLLLGAPALDLAYKRLDSLRANFDAWKETTLEADYPQAREKA